MRFSRAHHETRAIELVRGALFGLGTSPGRTIQATRDIAQARVHVSSIGMSPRSSRRTMRLWALICKAERRIARATAALIAAAERGSR